MLDLLGEVPAALSSALPAGFQVTTACLMEAHVCEPATLQGGVACRLGSSIIKTASSKKMEAHLQRRRLYLGTWHGPAVYIYLLLRCSVSSPN